MTIFTIGYEGMALEQFLSVLTRHKIQHLVDVRAVAMSRKQGFAKTALSNALAQNGIEYSHWPMLGCPNDIRVTYRMNGDWEEYTEQFLPYLETQADTVSELAEVAESQSCVLLCFEADANYCHRSFVAKAVQEHSEAIEAVVHLTKNSLPSVQPALALAGR